MAITSAGLKTHIWNNNAKSIIVVCLYPFFIGCLVWLCAYVFGMSTALTSTPSQFAWGVVGQYWWIVLAVCVGWFCVSWVFHTKMVRTLSQSHSVTRRDEPELYNLLENLSIAAGIPMPRLEIIETHAKNAFASGVSQDTFTVTVTRGLMQSLAKDELEAVLAHELTHIQNRDVRLLIITIIFTGMLGFAAQLSWRLIRHRFIFTGQRRKDGRAIIVILFIAGILWLGYVASLFMRFFISRKREYMADAGAIEMTKNPSAMMRALMRIQGRDRAPEITDDIALMCIENAKPFFGIFATHPPIKERVRTISKMTGEPVPDLNLAKLHKADYSPIKSERQNPWLIRTRRKK